MFGLFCCLEFAYFRVFVVCFVVVGCGLICVCWVLELIACLGFGLLRVSVLSFGYLFVFDAGCLLGVICLWGVLFEWTCWLLFVVLVIYL